MIETDRLFIRPIETNDKDDVYHIFSLDEIAKPYGMKPLTKDRLDNFLSELIKSQEYLILQKDTMQAIGTIGIVGESKKCKRAEIGYGIMPKYWNQGYTTEAVTAYVSHLFNTTDVNRLEAFVYPNNIYSCKILDNLGFTCEGLLKQRGFSRGEFQDYYLYRLLRDEYNLIADKFLF